MPFISVTRLRIRSLRFLLPFLITNQKATQQIKKAIGFLRGKLLVDRRLTFWTLTAWESEKDMRAYRNSGAHLKAMPKLVAWCDEAHAAHWNHDGAELPDWHEAYRHISAPQARVSKVRHPSNNHPAKTFPPPRVSKLEATVLPKK